jgi:virginiamycin A acetyltransferase
MLGRLIEILRLKLWLRAQHDSQALRTYFRTRFDIDVGYYSYGCFDRWRMPGPLRIGRYCSIANSVRVAPGNHPLDALTTHPALYEAKFGVIDSDTMQHQPLIVEDDVWIGHNAILLPGCKHIGRGAVIGAGSIVTRDVPAYAIVAGNPARVLRQRFAPEMIAALERSAWWTLDAADLRGLAKVQPDLLFHPSVASLDAWTAARDRYK